MSPRAAATTMRHGEDETAAEDDDKKQRTDVKQGLYCDKLRKSGKYKNAGYSLQLPKSMAKE